MFQEPLFPSGKSLSHCPRKVHPHGHARQGISRVIAGIPVLFDRREKKTGRLPKQSPVK